MGELWQNKWIYPRSLKQAYRNIGENSWEKEPDYKYRLV